MRVDPSTQLRLLDLQQLDTRLDQLAHRRSNVPQLAELATLAAQASALRDRDVAVRTQVSDLERALIRAEADVAQVRERINRDRALLEAGSVSSARQLADLQREVGSLGRRQGDLEEVELDVMERLEAATSHQAEVTTQAEALAQARETAERGRDEAFADIDNEADRVRGERDRVVVDLPEPLLTLYERIRRSSGGMGAAALHRGRCQGCQLTLSPGDLSTIRAAASDEVVRCEECRRILVRTPESGL